MLIVICAAFSGAAYATSPNGIVISAFQTESSTSASEEFITVHNTTQNAVDITGWRLQYYSATTTSFGTPTRTVTLAGSLGNNTDMTVSSTGYTAKGSTIFYSATLSATGGHLRLISGTAPNEVVHDVVGWGNAVLPEGTAADVVARGTEYKRRLVGGQPVDTDNNKNDFSSTVAVDVQQPDQTVPSQSNSSVPQQQESGSTGLLITELMPDPAAPLTDANDEFIELFNDTNQAISLTGYTLQTGNSFSYSYVLSGTLASHTYLVLYSSQTKLTLSNTSGKARIIDTTGGVIDETAAYEAAPTGSSWQLYDNQWSWNSVPSAGLVNNSPPVGAQSVAKVKSVTTKTTATKAKATSKAAKQAAQKSQNQSASGQTTDQLPQNSVNKSVIAGVGVLALGYILYEYRYDIAQKYRQLRGHKASSNTPSE